MVFELYAYRYKYKQNKTKQSTQKVHTQSSLSLSERTKKYFSFFFLLRFAFTFLVLLCVNTLHSIQYAVAFPIHDFYLSIIFFLLFKIDLNEFNARKPQIKFQNLWSLLYLPRICVFCVQFKEIVPRIV